MKKRKSGNGVKVAKEIVKNVEWQMNKDYIYRVFCTKENVQKAGLKYKKDLFPMLLQEIEKQAKKAAKKQATILRNIKKKEMGAKTIAEMKELEQKEAKLTMLLTNFPYRQSESRWVSPENEVSLRIRKGKIKGFGNGFKIYSDNGKWSGTDSEYRFTIPKSHTLQIIGGLITAIEEKDLKKLVKPCVWWEQSRGFTLKQKEGFIVRGYHSEAETSEKALKNWKAMKKRKHIAQKKLEKKVLTIQYCKDRFGWCETGIRSFMKLNNIENLGSITVKELRNIVIKNRKLNCTNYKGYLKRLGIILNCK